MSNPDHSAAPTAQVLETVIEVLAIEIRDGVLPSTIEARITNNGFAADLAAKVTRLAEIAANE